MSDVNKARRADTQVVLGGMDISVKVNDDLLSLTFTDNEEDEADDLQIKVLDREGNWMQKWLDTLISDAASGGEIINQASSDSASVETVSSSSSGSSGGNMSYKVTATSGVNVRSTASESGKVLGKLPYGMVVTVKKFVGSWANITYSGRTAYIKSANLKALESSDGSCSTNSTSSNTSTYSTLTNVTTYSGGDSSGNSWKIGDEVICSGRPQISSWGGSPGAEVTNHKGKITYLNLAAGIPYPIHIDYLGWFAENQVRKASSDVQQIPERSGSRGLKISAVIIRENWNGDGKDDVLDCGEFELDSVDADGPPATVTIKATSLPYSCSVRQTQKSKSWENVTLKDIVQAIAKNNGLTVMFESVFNPKYTRVEQYRMSDIAFLQKLCHDAGASLKATNKILVIFDQSAYEQKKAVRTIRFGEQGGYEKYRLYTGTNDIYTSCRVSYTTPSGTVISATEYAENYREEDGAKNQCLNIHQKVSSVAEAQLLAHKMLRLYNKYEYKANFTFPGDTSLTAGCAVELEDFGAWSGKYIIKQAKHSVSRSGYTTQVTLRKALNEAAKTAITPADDDAAIDKLAQECIRGDWGNGQERIDRLTAAGHDYSRVQARVNKILYG